MCPQVDIKLLKRQDLVSVMSNMMKPAHDQVQIRVNMNSDEMDSFVFCLSGKKVLNDITAEPGSFWIFVPVGHSTQWFTDSRIF